MYKILIINVFYLILNFQTILAQENSYFLQTHINTQNGLPQNSVLDAHFSKSGYFWLATEDGLVRFDGKNCRTFNISNSKLGSNRISQFIVPKSGELFCLTDNCSIYQVIESDYKTEIKFIETFSNSSVIAHHFFKVDSLPFLKRMRPLINPENFNNTQEYTLFVISDRKLTIQRGNDELLVYDSLFNLTKKIQFPGLEGTSLFVSDEKLYGLTAKKKFVYIDVTTCNIKPMFGLNTESILHSRPNSINDDRIIWNYKTGNTFYCNQNTLYEIGFTNGIAQLKKKINDLPLHQISTINYSLDSQLLIISTLSNGIYIYRKKAFTVLISPKGKNAYLSQSFHKQSASIITSNPLKRINDLSCDFLADIPNINNNTSYLINNTLWLNQSKKLISFDLITQKVTRQLSLPEMEQSGIEIIDAYDSNSLIILSKKALYIYNIDTGFTLLDYFNPTHALTHVYSYLKENETIHWIGTYDGLYQFNVKTKVLFKHSLHNKIVRSLFKTKNGILLAGTYGAGYYSILQNEATPIPLDKHKNLISTHTFIEDNNGFLWMSSNNGLYKVRMREIEDYLAKKSKAQLYYFKYGHQDGLLTNEFNGGCFPSSVQIQDGKWSLPSMQGIVQFYPDSNKSTFSKGKLRLDKIVLNDQTIQFPIDSIISTLKHTFRLSIYVSTPNWSDIENQYFTYKFSKDKEWISLLDNSSPIIIQNLKGGIHELIIRKKTGFGEMDYEELKLKIQVPKLMHEYWWFWPLVTLGVLCIIYYLNKYSNYKINERKTLLEKMVISKTSDLKNAIELLEQKNVLITASELKLKEENELKNSLLFLLSHDIATPLRYMNMFLKNYSQKDNFKNLSNSELIELQISASNLETLLNSIVQWIKETLSNNSTIQHESFNLYDLMEEKIQLFSLINENKGNQVKNNIQFDTKLHSDRFIVGVAIQNIFGNATNFTKNAKIEITFTSNEEYSQIDILDEGIGLTSNKNEQQKGYGIGLKITEHLLKLLNAKLIVKTKEGSKGTVASLILMNPVKK